MLVNHISGSDSETGFIWAAMSDNSRQRVSHPSHILQMCWQTDLEAADRAVLDALLEPDKKEPLLKLFDLGD